jgi:hypothetical protein
LFLACPLYYIASNYIFSTELTTISEPAPITAEPSLLPFVMVKIVAGHPRTLEALAATSTDPRDNATLCTSYENTNNLTHTQHSSQNLTNQFAILVTKTEDLILECDTTISDHNMLTTQVMQLKAQLMQTLAIVTTTTNVSPAGHKGQTDPEKFTIEDHGKLRSFVALLHLCLIDHPGEFPNEQCKLR